MAIQLDMEFGKVNISEEVVAVIAGSALWNVMELVGMASRKQLKDGIAELLGRGNLSRGVEVRQQSDSLHIDLYIIVSYGTKISEVAHNIQAKVKYVLEHDIGLAVDQVNIFVQDVRVLS